MATTLDAKINGTTSTGEFPIFCTYRLGSASTSGNHVTQIAASMVEAQATNNDGVPIAWLSGYVQTPFTLAGQVGFSLNATESVSTVNVTLSARLMKLPADITAGHTLVGTFSYVTELATGAGDRTWNGTPGTPVSFEVNSRLMLVYLFVPVGTAGAGTATINNDAQNAISLTETVTFSETPILTPIRSVPVLGQPRPLF